MRNPALVAIAALLFAIIENALGYDATTVELTTQIAVVAVLFAIAVELKSKR